MINKVLSMIGLCKKAGKLVSGEFLCEKVIKEKKAKLVIVAEDASDNTKQKFLNMCKYYDTDIRFFCTKEKLGASIGKDLRASISILDKNFTDFIIKQIDDKSE